MRSRAPACGWPGWLHALFPAQIPTPSPATPSQTGKPNPQGRPTATGNNLRAPLPKPTTTPPNPQRCPPSPSWASCGASRSSARDRSSSRHRLSVMGEAGDGGSDVARMWQLSGRTYPCRSTCSSQAVSGLPRVSCF
eukprot:11153269-Alexandrium_andersonii.AAC.3